MNEVTTLAFILKTVPYKENDRLVYAYTKEFGKLTFIAKGVNKLTSKNAYSLQELTLVEMTVIPKKRISTFIKANIVEFYRFIKEDIVLQVYSSYIMEYIYKQEEENNPNEEVFNLIFDAMNALLKGYPPKLVYSLFNIKMLALSGTQLVVDQCSRCHEVKPMVSISVKDGGFICCDCKQEDPLFSKEQLKLFRHLVLLGFKRIDDIHYQESDLMKITKIIEDFVEEYSGIYFQTKKFMTNL